MKRIVNFGISLLFIGTLTSCEDDPFTDDNGDTRDAFVGTWTVAEDSKLIGQRNYLTEIEKSTSFPSRVNIFDFYKLGVNDSVYATVSSVLADALTIPNQTLSGNLIYGNGTLVNDNLINMTFYVDDGNDIDTVEAVYTK